MTHLIDSEKLIAEIKHLQEKFPVATYDALYHLITSLQQEQPSNMIQWTGNNLKEVIDFTCKSPRFGEWFKSWDEYENYVHTHNDILKLFCEDGSHYEVPVGAWIVKTPDGYNVPSVAKYIQQEQPMPNSTELIAKWEEEKDVLKQMNFRGDGWLLAQNAFMDGFGIGLSVKKQEQPEVDLDAEIAIYLNRNVLNRINYFDIIEDFTTMEAGELAEHFYELGLNARKEK